MKTNKTARNPVTGFLLSVLGNPKWQPVAVPIFSILCSLVAASLVILLVGRNPLSAFYSLLQGAGIVPKGSYSGGKGLVTDLLSMLGALTPMLFAALGVAVAFKTGLFNIGISGQMLAAGFVATVTVGYSGLPGVVAKPLVLAIGFVCGGAVGAMIGLLKHRFNINEVVSSIMLNYILQYIVSFLIVTRYVDPVSRQSRAIRSSARLTLTGIEAGGYKLEIPVCFLLAIGAAFLLRLLLDRTRLGFELKVTGANSRAAEYAGIRVGRSIVTAMALSGGLAGLAGVTHYLGYYNSIIPKELTSVGFDSIAVALLGNANPIGILFSSLLVTVISKGSTYMSSAVDVRQEIAQVITGLILLFSACSAYVVYIVNRARSDAPDRREKGGRG